VRCLFAFILSIFFSKIIVSGRENLPAEGPAILVANHVNSLLDPLLLFMISPRRVRFLAKAPLFKHPLVAPFLKLLGAVPVYRHQDPGSDMSQNAATFKACEQALMEGDVVALFPEGLSHSEPHLQPLKTGAARITGRACRRGAAVRLIPVGLNYSAKGDFRSRVTVLVGDAVPYEDLPWGTGESPEAVVALTKRIEEGLEETTVNAECWEDVRFIEDLRPLALELRGLSEEELPEAEAEARMLERYYRAKREQPAELRALSRKARPYFRTLKLLGLEDEDVKREVDTGEALAYTWKRVLFLTVLYPPAFYGWLFHLLPYRLTGPLARTLAAKEDLVATTKLYVGLGAFPLFYVVQAGLLWWTLGPLTALVAAVLAVPCGLWSLRYYEARDEFFRLAVAYLTLGTRKRTAARLRAMRAQVTKALAPFVEMFP